MTEMIIDGVDVSECGFLDIHRPTKLLLCEECNSDFAAMECKDDPNCYYKQLKRLESENTKLKEKLKKIKEKCKFFISKCNECENPDTTIDCIDCTTGGKAIASYKILNIIEDIEGAEDDRN